jgi:hypothetical protein
MQRCKLCLKEKPLQNSHIIPEFCYKSLYDGKHRAFELKLREKGREILQKGIREKLLCADCEGLINTEFENPFYNFWFEQIRLPVILPNIPYVITGINYERFNLFHLSVLFRSSVSSLREFAEVQLGPYEEKIRIMLLSNRLKNDVFFKIGAAHINNSEESKSHLMIISPYKDRFCGANSSIFTFGGCVWHYIVSRHLPTRTDGVILHEKGTLPLMSINWKKIAG